MQNRLSRQSSDAVMFAQRLEQNSTPRNTRLGHVLFAAADAILEHLVLGGGRHGPKLHWLTLFGSISTVRRSNLLQIPSFILSLALFLPEEYQIFVGEILSSFVRHVGHEAKADDSIIWCTLSTERSCPTTIRESVRGSSRRHYKRHDDLDQSTMKQQADHLPRKWLVPGLARRPSKTWHVT